LDHFATKHVQMHVNQMKASGCVMMKMEIVCMDAKMDSSVKDVTTNATVDV
jgi:hypothetical protein